MTTRQTSIEAFHKIRESGLLSKRRWEVYAFIFERGPCTARQVSEAINGGWKRVSELESIGLVREVGQTKDSVTGQTVLLWDVTDAVPTDKPKHAKRECAKCKELEAKVAALEAELAPLKNAIRIMPRPAVATSAASLAGARA